MKRASIFLTLLLVGLPVSNAEETEAKPDRIEVQGGAVLTGQIESVEAGAIQLQTDYAGRLTVDIAKVERLDLGSPRDLGLPAELMTRYTSEEGQAEVPKAPETPETKTAAAPKKATVANAEPSKSWNLEAGLDLNGKSGNADRFDLRLNVEAELERNFDRTNLYGRYAYGTNQGQRSADEIIGGAKYTNFLLDRTGIFLRGEAEQDDAEGIRFRSTSAAGFSYRFQKENDLRIEARSGFSYRYEDYKNDGDESFPGMDLGLDVTWTFVKWARFKGTYTFLPSVDDPNDFIFEQDSGFNLPLDQGNFWKLRFGIASQYNNQPDGNREKLDMRYYARLIATWF